MNPDQWTVHRSLVDQRASRKMFRRLLRQMTVYTVTDLWTHQEYEFERLLVYSQPYYSPVPLRIKAEKQPVRCYVQGYLRTAEGPRCLRQPCLSCSGLQRSASSESPDYCAALTGVLTRWKQAKPLSRNYSSLGRWKGTGTSYLCHRRFSPKRMLKLSRITKLKDRRGVATKGWR